MASRKPLALLLVLLPACPAVNAQTGQPCSQGGLRACEAPDGDVQRVLECDPSDGGTGDTWAVYADCRGEGGCSVQDDSTLSCDTFLNTQGDRCPPSSEGKARCDPAAVTRILRCEGGVLTTLVDCPMGTNCARVDGGLSCL